MSKQEEIAIMAADFDGYDVKEFSDMNDETSDRLAELFKVLGDPTRIRILSLVTGGEMRVGDIALATSMGQSAISHQLRVLWGARLVKARREGKEAWYSLDDDHVLKLMNQGLDHVSHG